MNAKHLIQCVRADPALTAKLPLQKFKTSKEILDAQLTVSDVKRIAEALKMPNYTVLRLYDLVVYSKLEKIIQSLFNPPS